MTAAVVLMLVLMSMIVTAFGVIVIVVMMVVAAAAFFVGVIVLVLVTVVMAVIVVVVGVIVTFTADVLGIHREQIEQGENEQADACRENHGPENAIRRQVGGDAAVHVKEQHHAAPKEERGDAEEMNECASA